MKDKSKQQHQDMQPFVNALRQFFNIMETTKPADGEFNRIISTYLARLVTGVLETMAQLTPIEPEESATLPSEFFEATSATAGFAGAYTGAVSIHCSTVLAGMLAARMTGIEYTEDYADIHDALGEMASVLAGEIKQALSFGGLDIQLSPPGVVYGSHYLLSATNHQRVTVCFRIEGMSMYVSMVAERNRFLQAAAAELRDKREWLTLALEGGRLGLWHLDVATGTSLYSDECATMLGYTEGELASVAETWESLMHPDDILAVRVALQDYLCGHSPQYVAEHRLLCKSGDWRWILTRGRAVERHDDGTTKLLVGTHLDITERKAAELALYNSRKQLKLLNEQLEERVAEEVRKNRENDIRLLQHDKLAAIGQLAAGVAHEINNPMGFIMANLTILKQYSATMVQYIKSFEEITAADLSDGSQSALQETRKLLDIDYIINELPPLLAESTEGAKRIRRIVLDLKDFARLDEQEIKEADLNQLVESTVNMVRGEIKYVASLDLQLCELPPLLFCHPQQINQVISNLLINAAQAIDKQGVITIRTFQAGSWVILSVTDTGKGIPRELHNRIFDPFFTTKDVGKGTGLGLSISYDIIKKHGGEITVASEVGSGSTFTIKLPVIATGHTQRVNSGA